MKISTQLLLPTLVLSLSIWEQLLTFNPNFKPAPQSIISTTSQDLLLLSQSEAAAADEDSDISITTQLLLLHKHLSTHESISGNEESVTKYLSQYLTSHGFKVHQQDIPNTNRSNIYAYHGDSKSAKVVLTSHLDTVPGYFPYYITSNNTLIYGRGVNDAKGSVASQVIAARELYQSGAVKAGELGLLFVVGEEVDGIGMEYVTSGPDFQDAQWDHVIFGEPTELSLGVGHKGVYHFEVNVQGKAGHSGYPELGIDANLELIDIIQKMRSLEFEKDELLGVSTVNFGRLEGGLAANVVSPAANAKVLVRVAANVEDVRTKFLEVINDEISSYYGRVSIEEFQVKEPVYLDFDIPGFNTSVLKYFTDVPNLVKDSIKSKYLYGPGSILNAHTPDEHLAVQDLIDGVEGYKELVGWLLENKY